MKASPLYKFFGSDGRFRSDAADRLGSVYFPIANELGLLSALTPDLAGDIKLDQHTFFSLPTAFEDIHLNRSARNFWLAFKSPNGGPWSRTSGPPACPPPPSSVSSGRRWRSTSPGRRSS